MYACRFFVDDVHKEESRKMNECSIPITVIIPVYNCKKYLEAAVNSVLGQTYDNLRIVIVDDGSTDGSSELCDRLAEHDRRIHVMHKPNGGVSSARNMGIDHVLKNKYGGYIAFLDADDFWLCDFFDEKVCDLVKRGYDLLGFQSIRCNNSATRYNVLAELTEGEYIGNAKNVWEHRAHCGAMLYSVNLIERYNIRFIKELKINEDMIFHVQCTYLCKTFYLYARNFYAYRCNHDSVSHKKIDSQLKYPSIIRGWISLDERIESLDLQGKGTLVEGHILAANYVLDMHDEHYQQFGTKRNIEKVMAENPKFSEYLESPLVRSISSIAKRLEYMCEHPLKYRIRCYAVGIKSSFISKAYSLIEKNKFLLRIIDRYRYRHKLINICTNRREE